MTLGERIYQLRGKAGLSQGKLAEKIGVSRQSVSKWETDASIPELEKLVQLSDLFGVTLDELVRQEKPETEPPETGAEPLETGEKPTGFPTRKIVGAILLGVGLLCGVLALMFGGGLLLVGGYFLVCGLICLTVRKYPGLVIGWGTLLPAMLLSHLYTGVRLLYVFHPGYYSNGLGINQLVGIGMWLFLVGLVVRTVQIVRRRNRETS